MAATRPTVGYFGAEGSFTNKAARHYFGEDVVFVPMQTFGDVFRSVKDGKTQCGVVPIENTLAGSIYENYDHLDAYDLYIAGELSLRIEHSLLMANEITQGKSESELLRNLRHVYSHQKALEQCTEFLKAYPQIKTQIDTSTASAAKRVSQLRSADIAAIADKDNAKLYDLAIIKEGIENNKHNFTRFIVISNIRQELSPEKNKCSITLTLPHILGSLNNILTLLTKYGCNLTKIESRPLSLQPYEYTFYLDFMFENPNILKGILKDISASATSMRVLGIYKDKGSI